MQIHLIATRKLAPLFIGTGHIPSGRDYHSWIISDFPNFKRDKLRHTTIIKTYTIHTRTFACTEFVCPDIIYRRVRSTYKLISIIECFFFITRLPVISTKSRSATAKRFKITTKLHNQRVIVLQFVNRTNGGRHRLITGDSMKSL